MTDKTAFIKELVNAQSELFRFAFKLTSDKEEANDLVQETSLKALDNAEKYLPDTNFIGWVYTIMRNIFINNYRKILRDQTFIDRTENLYHLNSTQGKNIAYTESSYDYKEIIRILDSFSEEYRRPFVLYIVGFKYKEIADMLKLPIGTVKSRIFSTRQKLQSFFKDK
jgi:RNA polymerase sigma-70 factor (ECF subfamily)